MEVSKQHYKQMVEKASPNSRTAINCLRAFVVGGGICAFGQLLHVGFVALTGGSEHVGAYVAVTLVFLAVLVTGLGKYDDIVTYAGAGASLPITGFANAVAAPAIEFKKEGWVFGVGAKMFLIAGPVIVYGTLASMLVGTIYYIIQLVR